MFAASPSYLRALIWNLRSRYTALIDSLISMSQHVRRLSLLPGLTPALIDDLLAVRALDSFNNRGEIGEVIPFENLTELSPWLSNETSDFYTIYVYRRPEPDPQHEPLQESQPDKSSVKRD